MGWSRPPCRADRGARGCPSAAQRDREAVLAVEPSPGRGHHARRGTRRRPGRPARRREGPRPRATAAAATTSARKANGPDERDDAASRGARGRHRDEGRSGGSGVDGSRPWCAASSVARSSRAVALSRYASRSSLPAPATRMRSSDSESSFAERGLDDVDRLHARDRDRPHVAAQQPGLDGERRAVERVPRDVASGRSRARTRRRPLRASVISAGGRPGRRAAGRVPARRARPTAVRPPRTSGDSACRRVRSARTLRGVGHSPGGARLAEHGEPVTQARRLDRARARGSSRRSSPLRCAA